MADKTQNININYKFNTAEIDKAAQSLAKVNQASNKLQQDAGKVGQAGAKGVQDWSKSIAGLESEMQRLKFRARNAVDPAEAKKYGDAWAGVKKQLDETTKSAGLFNKAAGMTNNQLASMITSFKGLSKIAGVGLLATATKEAVDFSLEMATLQGQVEGVERGFERAFPASSALIRDLQAATHDTMTDFDLMKRSLQATNLGVGVEHLATLFEFAAARAQQTGESVDYLVDSIVRGIGRKSPLVLDNLGISVTALKDKFNGASIASVSVAEATRGVAEIAKEQLEKMGGYVDTAETAVKRLGKTWEEVKIAIAKGPIGDFGAGFANFFADVLQGWADLGKNKDKQLEDIRAAQEIESLVAVELNSKMIKDQEKLNAAFQSELKKRFDMRKQNLVQLAILEEQANKIQLERSSALKSGDSDSFFQLGFALDAVVQKSLPLISSNRELSESLKLLKIAFDSAFPKPGDNNLTAMREELKGLIDTFNELKLQKDDRTKFVDPKEANETIDKIKKLSKEIKFLEDLLKDPKTLKVKVEFSKTIEDFIEEWKGDIHKFFGEGGDLKDVELNPFSGVVFDRKAIEATEIFDQSTLDAMDADVAEKAEHVADSFWTRFKLAFKRKSVTDKDLELQDAIVTAELTGIDILSDQFQSIASQEAELFDARLKRTKQFFEEQQRLAGNNEKAKDLLRNLEDRKVKELRTRQFIAEQKAAKQRALIDGAAAIVKTFATVGWPAGAVLAIAQAAATASQIAIIDRQQPRFAKGVIDLQGPGTTTSDSIPARLSKHESVMTAWETKNAGGILKEIRAKKLDDRVLRSLRESRHPVQGMSDQGIIRAIKENKSPDVIVQSGIVYKATKRSEDYIKKQRAKSIRI